MRKTLSKKLIGRLGHIWGDVKLLMKPVVIVSGLGYLVDAYDMMIFSVVRTASLTDMGLSGDKLVEAGLQIMNLQMAGLLLGGLVWGMLGDKLGRMKVLFASIIMYSVANFGCGFAQGVADYGVWRFMAGFGLAGEAGAAITIVTESLPKTKRGLGVMLVVACAAMGPLLAGIVGELVEWRHAYMIGGVAGFALLFLRANVKESKVFEHVAHNKKVQRGNLLQFVTNWSLFKRYVCCVLVGVPVWYIIGIQTTLAPEFARSMGVVGAVAAGTALSFNFVGTIVGEILCATMAQVLQSRRQSLILWLLLTLGSVLGYYQLHDVTAQTFYFYCGFLGISIGYWVSLMAATAEQFGTNLRASATTSIPNFIRGSLIPMNMMFVYLHNKVGYSYEQTGLIIGGAVVAMALGALLFMPETFHNDMDFVEEN